MTFGVLGEPARSRGRCRGRARHRAGQLPRHDLRRGARRQRLKQQGHGTIVALSSVAGERARRSNFVYGSSKAGMDAFLQGLGDSLVGTGVRVMVVRPGFVISKMTEGLDPAPLSTTPEAVADAIVSGPRAQQRDRVGSRATALRDVGPAPRPTRRSSASSRYDDARPRTCVMFRAHRAGLLTPKQTGSPRSTSTGRCRRATTSSPFLRIVAGTRDLARAIAAAAPALAASRRDPSAARRRQGHRGARHARGSQRRVPPRPRCAVCPPGRRCATSRPTSWPASSGTAPTATSSCSSRRRCTSTSTRSPSCSVPTPCSPPRWRSTPTAGAPARSRAPTCGDSRRPAASTSGSAGRDVVIHAYGDSERRRRAAGPRRPRNPGRPKGGKRARITLR